MNEEPARLDDPDLPCIEMVEIITDCLEDSLSPEERARFEAHLATCQGCRTYLQQMNRTIELTGRLREGFVPAPARRRLLEAFRSWKRA